jgi:hypothetical protein
MFLYFMVNELSQYDMGIAFKQNCVRKYWTLITMEHTETKDIHDYVINLNKWLKKKPIQWEKCRV